MRKVIFFLVIVAVVATTSLAAVSNPETFDTYADANDWAPTAAVEGWTISSGAGNPAEIGAAYANGAGKGVRMGNDVQGLWYAEYDEVTFPTQTLTVDFQVVSLVGGWSRIMIDAGAGGFGGAYQGGFQAEFTWTASGWDGYLQLHDGTSYVKTYIPGATSFADTNWHTLKVEMDFNTNQVRATFDNNASTAWVAMPVNDHPSMSGPAYSYTSIKTNNSAGNTNFDNYNLVPDPATIALLSVGGLMVTVRRKRKLRGS